MLERRMRIERWLAGARRGCTDAVARLATVPRTPWWRRLSSALAVTEAHVAALPRQVRVLIRVREDLSERLIGRVQLGVLVLFAALYGLGPRPLDAPMAALLDPVPITLALFGMFALVRAAMTERGRVPIWFLFASIVVDMGLLTGLIWSFHVHYGQTPPFSLRVPTFAYFFVFIALRALCFDYRLVLVAGLAAVLGWAGLVVLTSATAGPGAITHDFIGYMAGRGILIGAEIEKIAALAIVTLVLAIAVRRAEELLVGAVSAREASREIGRFLSHGVADVIARADTPIMAGEATDRNAAILMLDIRGFTAAAVKVEPKELVRALARLHARIVPIVREHGGVVDKFLGDGMMATFGAIAPSETAAADALKALDRMMGECHLWSDELAGAWSGQRNEVNASVVAGPIVLATLGSTERLEYTVIGDAVNLAAKLEKHNKVARTRALTTAHTMRLAMAQGYAHAGGEPEWRRGETIAGAARPVDIVVFVA